jgi:hypothetical protein
VIHFLRLHAGYRCRHSGVCCTEDWAIPVDAPLYRQLSQALASSALQPEHADAPYFETTDGRTAEPVVTGRVGRDCAFFEPGRGRLCAIHRQLGHDRLPSACQHFPRVVAIDPRGIFVSLSHVCPTAGRLLTVASEAPFDVVHEGPLVTPGLAWAGLDAREALPPQVSGAVLWDWDALTVWEGGILKLLGQHAPERALAAVADAARQLERWRPAASDTLARATESALATASLETSDRRIDVDALDALARRAVPDAPAQAQGAGSRVQGPESSVQGPGPFPDRLAVDRALVAPAWDAQRELVGRYLAARTIANAVGYHAASAGAWAALLDTAYAVLRTEAARQALQAGRMLDAGLLTSAAADADRLLVHRVDAARLAASLQTALRS